MHRYTVILASIVFSIFLIGGAVGEASAHTGSGWSTWTHVTWNSDYVAVHHKHVTNGTVCELIDRDGNITRFKDSRDIGNRGCTG